MLQTSTLEIAAIYHKKIKNKIKYKLQSWVITLRLKRIKSTK